MQRPRPSRERSRVQSFEFVRASNPRAQRRRPHAAERRRSRRYGRAKPCRRDCVHRRDEKPNRRPQSGKPSHMSINRLIISARGLSSLMAKPQPARRAAKRPAPRWSAPRSSCSAPRASRRPRRARSPRRRTPISPRSPIISAARRASAPPAPTSSSQRSRERLRRRRDRGRPTDADAGAARARSRACSPRSSSRGRRRRGAPDRALRAARDVRALAAFERLYRARSRRCTRAPARCGRARPARRPRAKRPSLRVFALLGQVVYFRIARAAVLRRMGWSDIGPREGEAIEAYRHRQSRRRARRRGKNAP